MADPRTNLGTQEVVQGDPLSWTLTFKQTASDGTVSALDLTQFGTTWAADLRQSPSQTPPVAFTVDSTSAATGVLKLSLTAAQTSGMTGTSDPTTWTFDLQVTGGAASPFTPYMGTVKVHKVFTHA